MEFMDANIEKAVSKMQNRMWELKEDLKKLVAKASELREQYGDVAHNLNQRMEEMESAGQEDTAEYNEILDQWFAAREKENYYEDNADWFQEAADCVAKGNN